MLIQRIYAKIPIRYIFFITLSGQLKLSRWRARAENNLGEFFQKLDQPGVAAIDNCGVFGPGPVVAPDGGHTEAVTTLKSAFELSPGETEVLAPLAIA